MTITKIQFLTSQAEINEFGNLVILVNNGEQIKSYDIMHADEREAVEAGVDQLFINFEINSVIEIGFGLGYTAQKFEQHGVQKHYIIEPHPEIYQMALDWRESQPNKDNIIIINDFYEQWDRRQEDGEMIKADLVYYDAADLTSDDPVDFITITEDTLQVYFKWATKLVAGYGRGNCEVSEYLEKFNYQVGQNNYAQPYKNKQLS